MGKMPTQHMGKMPMQHMGETPMLPRLSNLLRVFCEGF